eukprot:TRINITY_DN9738_c0_g1_i1.p2 TRINITY_DN9738_c0_g1~~TRINITY_DN9738_c0_g1_i1.p2  ORF type:complete len:402 (+),score=102.13 TRINITY_DN9738_c0_g1_i1:2111-3316(+)
MNPDGEREFFKGMEVFKKWITDKGVEVKVGDDVICIEEGKKAYYRVWCIIKDDNVMKAKVMRWVGIGDEMTGNWFEEHQESFLTNKELMACLDIDQMATVPLSSVKQKITIRGYTTESLALPYEEDYFADPPPQDVIHATLSSEGGHRSDNTRGYICCWSCFLSNPACFMACRVWETEEGCPGDYFDVITEPTPATFTAACKEAGLRAGHTGFTPIRTPVNGGSVVAELPEDEFPGATQDDDDVVIHDSNSEIINAMETSSQNGEGDDEFIASAGDDRPQESSTSEFLPPAAVEELMLDVLRHSAKEKPILERLAPFLGSKVPEIPTSTPIKKMKQLKLLTAPPMNVKPKKTVAISTPDTTQYQPYPPDYRDMLQSVNAEVKSLSYNIFIGSKPAIKRQKR